MAKFKGRKLSKAWLKSLAGLSINLSAAYFATVLILPNFSGFSGIDNWWILILDVLFGMVFLIISVYLEKKIR